MRTKTVVKLIIAFVFSVSWSFFSSFIIPKTFSLECFGSANYIMGAIGAIIIIILMDL
jgi:hypothetical protein